MPTVTDIKRQRRVESNRFNISVDGVYAFTLSDLDLSMSGLRVGQELTAEEVEGFAQKASEAKAYALALRFLGVRVRSRRELADYLIRKGCEPEDIEAALERLVELGLVDDRRFAEAWIADRQAVRPRSRLRLAQELAAKGVAREVVEAALQEIEPDQEVEALKNLIQRKQKLPAYGDERKLVAYLQRQGYRWGLIKEALGQLEDAE